MNSAEQIVENLLDDESNDPKDYVINRNITIPTGKLVVVGSHGEITCESATGQVLELNDDGDNVDNYRNIAVIDVDDYRKWVDKNNLSAWAQDGDTVDILFVGYWNKDGSYEPPDEFARLDYVADRKGAEPGTL